MNLSNYSVNKKKVQHVNSSTYPDQFDIYNYRLNSVRLTWCKEVKKILQRNFKFSKNLKINDFGCGYFPFYKELKLNNLKHNYFGFDNDLEILKIGIKNFPELKKKCKKVDIEKMKPIRKANISIVSALLEHLENPKKVLKYIIKNTEDCLILRIPVSEKSSFHIIKDDKQNEPWLFNVFKKKDIVNILEKNNFNSKFYIDKATQKHQIGSNLVKRLKKKIIILEATKKQK